MTRVFNFSPGPAALPEPVLRQAADEMLDWHGSGMSVMEMSHRGREFISIHAEAEALLRRSLEMMRQLFPTAPHADLGDVLNRLAFLLDARDAADADQIYEQAVAFERARGPGPYFVTDGYDYLARAALARGDRALAETLFRRAAQLYEAELPEGHPYRAAVAAGLAELGAAR